MTFERYIRKFPQPFLDAVSAHFRNECRLVLSTISEIREMSPDCRHSILSRKELEQHQEYKLEKRKHEFLSGRLCAKLAFKKYFSLNDKPENNLNIIAIDNDSEGRPYFLESPPELSPVFLSISHSLDYGCSSVSAQPCGIDIQSHSETLIKVKERYCTAPEEHLLNLHLPDSGDIKSKLAQLWAAKEAVKKCLSYRKMPGFLDLQLIEIDKPAENVSIMTFSLDADSKLPKHIEAVTTGFDQYGLALVILQG